MSSEQPHLELSFALGLSDVLAVQRSRFFRSFPGRVVSIIAILLGTAALILGSWSLAVWVGVWLVTMGSLLLYFMPRRSFLANPTLRGHQSWAIGADGLSFEITASDGSRLAGGERDWSSFVGTYESSEAFLLFSSPNQFSALPKRAMNPAQVADIRTLLAAKAAKESG